LRSKFFTLIELLIVVAIIGILVTLLMPSLNSAKEKAKIAVCLSNHKQMATAYLLYASTNGQLAVVHTWYRDFIGESGYKGWGSPEEERPLNQFADPEVGKCPSDKGAVNNNWNKSQWDAFGSSYYVTYASSTNVDKSTNVPSSKTGLYVTEFLKPDRKIMFYNSNLGFGTKKDWNHPSGKAKWHSTKNPQYPVSFIDGHAEFLNFSWKKKSGYYPKGTMNWRIENLGYY
jgi:prepilin-type N-terminal cleavage/methylation domain-containing protein